MSCHWIHNLGSYQSSHRDEQGPEFLLYLLFGIIMGLIMGAVHAFLYNVFAGRAGGIRLEF